MNGAGSRCLIADIGGTNSRFALATKDGLLEKRVLRTAEFDGITGLIDAYTQAMERPTRAALAIAGPVNGTEIAVTNRGWRCTQADIRKACGFEELHVMNDFAAIAWSLPALAPDDYVQVGGGDGIRGEPMAVIGPGTGLGVAAVVPHEGGMTVVSGEGGHVTLPALDSGQAKVLHTLRGQFGHVSAERVLSGSGLLNLYSALGGQADRPETVTKRAVEGDTVAAETMDYFFRWLGVVSGDLALTFGARGGVWLAGGILPQFSDDFVRSGFRDAFESKGRFREYLSTIPTRLITAPTPALTGLAHRAGCMSDVSGL